MAEMRFGAVEGHFAEIVWDHAPLTTRELVDLCAKELNWKRTTTYTVLKKMCNRGILDMTNSLVTVLIDRDEFHARQSEEFVEENFNGSLPAFIAAFTQKKELSQKDLEEIRKMMDSLEG